MGKQKVSKMLDFCPKCTHLVALEDLDHFGLPFKFQITIKTLHTDTIRFHVLTATIGGSNEVIFHSLTTSQSSVFWDDYLDCRQSISFVTKRLPTAWIQSLLHSEWRCCPQSGNQTYSVYFFTVSPCIFQFNNV